MSEEQELSDSAMIIAQAYADQFYFLVRDMLDSEGVDFGTEQFRIVAVLLCGMVEGEFNEFIDDNGKAIIETDRPPEAS